MSMKMVWATVGICLRTNTDPEKVVICKKCQFTYHTHFPPGTRGCL